MAERARTRFPVSIKRWPVRWRLAGVSAGLTLLILVIFALVVGRLATDRVKDDFHDELRSVASQLRNNLQLNRPASEGISGPDVLSLALTGDTAVRVVDSEGNIALSPGGRPLETPGAPDLGAPDLDAVSEVGNFDTVAVVLSDSSIPPLFLQYARSRDSLEDTLNKLWLFLAFGVVGGTVLAALAGLAVAGRAMSPIASLTTAARGIATTRDPSRRIPMPESEDEVAELAKTLDLMLRELDAARAETQQMIQAQRDFVADASHELRTPLTSILANLELLEAGFAERGADAEEEEIVAGALGSSRRMRRLVADLLLLARADAGRAGPRRHCDLAANATEAIAEVRPVAEGHRVELDASGSVAVEGNPDDLHRLVVNLVENGVRHTPPGSTVSVAVSANGPGEAVLEVSDDGPGLPDELGDQIFARFVRGGGPADLTTDSGTGLGLAIVKAVATSHHGRVDVGRSDAGGARFAVHLPLGEPARDPATLR
jgi:signal transduction histidine kinase